MKFGIPFKDAPVCNPRDKSSSPESPSISSGLFITDILSEGINGFPGK
jgi:hypothetical protein